MGFLRFIVVIGLLLFFCLVVESRSRHRRKKPDSISDRFEEQFRQGQQFMKHQVNSPHKNRGWKHGRRSSESTSSSSSFEHESNDNTGDNTGGQTEYERRFKEFMKSHKCVDSPVYNKFLQYYKVATINLKNKNVGSKFEIPWLEELANNVSSDCSNSCPNTKHTSDTPNDTLKRANNDGDVRAPNSEKNRNYEDTESSQPKKNQSIELNQSNDNDDKSRPKKKTKNDVNTIPKSNLNNDYEGRGSNFKTPDRTENEDSRPAKSNRNNNNDYSRTQNSDVSQKNQDSSIYGMTKSLSADVDTSQVNSKKLGNSEKSNDRGRGFFGSGKRDPVDVTTEHDVSKSERMTTDHPMPVIASKGNLPAVIRQSPKSRSIT